MSIFKKAKKWTKKAVRGYGKVMTLGQGSKMKEAITGGGKAQVAVNKTTLPDWLDAGSQDAVASARKINARPYQAYEGDRIAGISDNERFASNRATQGSGYEADFNESRDLSRRGSQSFLNADIEGYMNPYIDSALEPGAREIREQMARDQEGVKSNAASLNAFGGSRARIMGNETYEKGLQGLSDFYKTGYASAFESAATRFDADRNAARSGADQFRQMGGASQEALSSDIQNLLTTGGLERTLKQADLSFDYQQFLEARDWDITNLEPLVKTLSAVPSDKTTTTTGGSGGGGFGSLLGLAATVAGAYFTGGASLAMQAGIGAVATGASSNLA